MPAAGSPAVGISLSGLVGRRSFAASLV